MGNYNYKKVPKVLLVANVAKEHVLKFHVPTLKMLVDYGWQVDVACGGIEEIPYCNRKYELPIDRSPFKTNFIKAIHKLKQLIKEEQYDIVYCHTTVGGIIGRIAAISARKKGTKVVKFAHGTYFYSGMPVFNWLYYPLYKVLSWVTDTIITITLEDYEFTKRHFSHAKVFYVPGIGVDPNRFLLLNRNIVRQEYRKKMGIPQDAYVLIYVAELIKNKNQKLLLDTLKLLHKTRPNTYLILVGPDHTKGAYLNYAHKLNIDNKTFFLGWRSDIAELYAMSDICAASSIREGLGLNIVEAMICGIPVVATNNSGHRAVIQNGVNGLLCPIGNAQKMKDLIELLISSSKTRDELLSSAQSEITKYYTVNVNAQILNILQQNL